MQERDDERDPLRHGIELPEGAVVVGVVEIVEYIDAEDPGTGRYSFRFPNDMSYSNMLGLLELVKASIIGRYLSMDDDED